MYKRKTTKLVAIGPVLLWLLIILLLLTPVYCALSNPAFVQVSDFGTTFYIAARLVKEGKVSDLYPVLDSYMLHHSAFTTYSHQLLSSLPASQIPLFQYPPLLAYLIEPISYLSLQDAFFVWQFFSVLALCLSIFLLASLGSLNWIVCLGMSLLYLPILHTLLTGQIGLILILLPLSLGYFLLMRGHSLAAGLVWSFLILKIQFLPLALLFVITSLFAKNWRCAAGFVFGVIVLIMCNIFCLGRETTHQWLQLLDTSDALGIDPSYSCNTYLQTSLPRALLQLVPLLLRAKWRIALYFMATSIMLHAFYTCAQLVKRTKDYLSVMPYCFVLGIFLMPMISPHLFFYDLGILALAGIVIYGEPRFRADHDLIRDLLIGWFFIDIYLVLFVFINPQLAQPIIPVAILAWLYLRILKARRTWLINNVE